MIDANRTPQRQAGNTRDVPERSPRAKRFRRASSPPSIRLTNRDRQAVAALATHRFLTADQLRRLVFRCSASRVRRRLRLLYDHELIARVPLAAQPTAGVPPFVYTLARHGLAALDDLSPDEIEKRLKTSTPHVQHRLAVNEFFIALTEAVRDRPYTILNWRHEHHLRIPTEDGWGTIERIRHPLLNGDVAFLPDAAFELEVAPGRSFFYFVEIDRSTHSQRVWRKRAKLYTAYADPQYGFFQRRFGRQTFRLLTITKDDFRRRSRRRNILASIQRTVGASDLFLAATSSQVRSETVLERVWRQPGSNQLFSILDNPRPPAARVSGNRRIIVRRRPSN